MQVKTFVYGTPLGFNFYEDDSQYKDYFKGFYISSREGRQLMVNRLDDGETTYNFLCYRIAEYGNRPNAFFGMSFVLNDFLYCSDFGNLYNWFNFLFDKLISERRLITKQGEELHYNVAKFEEDKDDVEWLKSNMPNILSSPEIKLQKYDASFSDKKTGKIPKFGNNEKPDTILKAFKQSRWICLSSIFGGSEEPELDFGELSQFVDFITKQLLPIAINPEKKHVPVLKEMHSVLYENYKSISDFLQKTQDEDRKKMFQELGLKYYDIFAKQLPQIAQKIDIGQSDPQKPQTTRECPKCGKQKPLSAFADGDTICIECRTKEVKPIEETRSCQTCGKKKPIDAFATGDTICIECREHESSGFVLPTKYMYGGLAAVALKVVSLCTIIFWPSKENGGKENQEGENQIVLQEATDNKVQEITYDGYIANHQFLEAYEYILTKDDADVYKIKLKDSFEYYLITLDFDKIQESLIRCHNLCVFVGVDIDKWNHYVEDGTEISTKYLSKTTISDTDRSACQILIGSYKSGIYNGKAKEWETKLNAIPKTQAKPVEQQIIKVVLYNADYTKVKDYEINKQRTIEVQQFKVGGYVDVYCHKMPTCIRGNGGVDAMKQTGSNPPFRIKPKNPGEWVYQCDDAQITIKTKKFESM